LDRIKYDTRRAISKFMNNDIKLQATNCQLIDVAALVFEMPTARLQFTP
jgi:hypothetical protein